MNRVYIKTYGCQMNERDSEAVAAMLRGRGYSIVPQEDDADIVLLNTCSVRDLAEQKAIGKAGHLNRRRKKNPNFILGMMGCMVQNRGAELLDRLPDLDLLVGTQKFHRVPDHLDNLIATMRAQGPKPSGIVDLEAEEGSQNTIRAHDGDQAKTSAFVSIMQGCNMKCSFCIVPKTRGPERARPMHDILEEIEELADQGTREVTLLGQIVNQYGVREFPYREGKSPFVQLLEAVNAIPGIRRIRFTSPHPVGFRQDLIDCYGRLEKLCESIHFPLQSGSDRVLREMRRPYTVERYQRILQALRERCPDIAVSTDVIVGFPTETDEDFEQTKRVFASIGFDMAFVFKYSVRPDTTASPLGDPIPNEVKEARNQALLDILHKSSLRRNQSIVGHTMEVLVEAPARRGEDVYYGRTRTYRKIFFPANPRLVGQLVPVKIHEAAVSHCTGELLLHGVS